jgi:BirA family transcriptional regulator, biotin operon repressor / biotin---[acetyl-CoA-carboxylase] ligase
MDPQVGPGLTQHTVEAAVAAAGFHGVARFAAATGSTNEDLLRAAVDGAPAWSVLVAGHQDAGRGRLGRTWVEAPGSSLLLSVLVRPAVAPADAPLLTLAAGAGMVAAVAEAARVEVGCKWPNDLRARERKLGGILAEAVVDGGRLRHVVIGIGLNVDQSEEELPEEVRATATSVRIEGGRTDLAALLDASLRHLRRALDADGPAFRQRTLEAYRAVCETIGRRVLATTTTGERVEGLATGVGDEGQLEVEADGRVVHVAFGEVEHLR